MILEMKVPSPGESITEVEIAQWLVADGDYVEKDQAIAEVDSDKATLELPAEVSGTITLKAEEGDAVAVGAIVCLIDTTGKGEASTQVSTETSSSEVTPPVSAPKATIVEEKSYAAQTPSPAARKIINEKGLDPKQINGTGKGG
ncbi:MAG: biotin/lipoyl-containing protein, partial [Flavobacteriaceae bacterium]